MDAAHPAPPGTVERRRARPRSAPSSPPTVRRASRGPRARRASSRSARARQRSRSAPGRLPRAERVREGDVQLGGRPPRARRPSPRSCPALGQRFVQLTAPDPAVLRAGYAGLDERDRVLHAGRRRRTSRGPCAWHAPEPLAEVRDELHLGMRARPEPPVALHEELVPEPDARVRLVRTRSARSPAGMGRAGRRRDERPAALPLARTLREQLEQEARPRPPAVGAARTARASPLGEEHVDDRERSSRLATIPSTS